MAVESSTDGDGARTRSRRARFREWRHNRPFAGGILLMLAGLLIAYVPLQFAFELLLVGGAYTYIGLLWAVGVFLTGAFVLYRPEFSTIFGVLGVVLSILSLLGALGGLVVGMIVGIVGGNLCIAWSGPDPGNEARREDSGDDRPAVRTDGGTPPDGPEEPPEESGAATRLSGLVAALAATGPLSRLRSDGDAADESSATHLERARRRARRSAREASSALDRARSSVRPGRIADAATSGWTTKRLAMTFALLVVASGTLTLVSAAPAAAILGDNQRTTYTVDVGEIRLGEGGQICAASVGSDAYRVTITDATLVDATIYQQRGGEAVKTNFPELEVEDAMVMYTTSDDEQLDLLATTVGCTDEDQTSRTVFRNEFQQSSMLRGSEGVTMLNMEAVDGSIPEAGGFRFAGPEDNGSSTEDDVAGVGNVTGDVRSVADTIDDVINGTLEDRLLDDTGALDDPEEPIDRVDETVGGVNGTAGGVNETVGGVGDTIEDATPGPDDAANATGDVTNATEDVTNATDDVANTTEDVTNATDDVANTTEDVTNATEDATNATDDVANTTEDVTNATDDVANATEDVTNATGDVVSSVDETVENTTRRATDDEAPENASGAADGTTDAVDNTTVEATGTADDVADATDEAAGVDENRTSSEVVDGTTDPVDDTTDEVTDGVDDTTDGDGDTTDGVIGATSSSTSTATSSPTSTETEATPTATDVPVTETTTVVPTATPEDDAALPDWFDQVDDDEQESVLETVEETDGEFDDVSNVTEETDHLSEDAIESDENLTQLDNGTVLLLNGTDPADVEWESDLPIETEVPSITDTETATEAKDESDATTPTDSEAGSETDPEATRAESDSDDGLFRLAG